MSTNHERLTVYMPNEKEHQFLSPPFDQSGYFQWWHIADGVLMITLRTSPRLVRCLPLVSIEAWEHEYDVDGDDDA